MNCLFSNRIEQEQTLVGFLKIEQRGVQSFLKTLHRLLYSNIQPASCYGTRVIGLGRALIDFGRLGRENRLRRHGLVWLVVLTGSGSEIGVFEESHTATRISAAVDHAFGAFWGQGLVERC